MKAQTLPEGITVEVEPNKTEATVGEIVHVVYRVNLESKNKIDSLSIISFYPDMEGILKVIYHTKSTISDIKYSEARHKYNYTLETTVCYRALREGVYHTSPKLTIWRDKKYIDLALPVKEIVVWANPDGGVQTTEDAAANNRRVKAKDYVLMEAELSQTRYQVGDTVRCHYYILTKVTFPPTNIQEVYSTNGFKMKNCDWRFVNAIQPQDTITSELDEECRDTLEEFNNTEENNVKSTTPENVIRNGQYYTRLYLGYMEIIPQKPGEYTIPRLKMKCLLITPKTREKGRTYIPEYKTIERKVATQPVKFTVGP